MTMSDNVLRIPIDPDCTPSSKRISPLRHHWLEITCPRCGTVDDSGKRAPDPIFCYGDPVTVFNCHTCDMSDPSYREEPAYQLERLEKGFAVISKVPGFQGKIEYCYYQRTVGETI